MFIYIFTILVLTFFAVLEANISDYFKKQTINKFLLPAAWLLIVSQMALRWEMATDWHNYMNFFEHEGNWEAYYSTPPIFEKGYWIFNILVKSIYSNYTFFLFALEGLMYFMLFRTFKFATPNFFLCILLYYTFFMGLVGSNRQLFALGICMMGLLSLMKGNKLLFIGFVVLAFYFHTTAVLFFVFLFLGFRPPAFIAVLFVLLCFIIGKTDLPFQVFASLSGVSEYNATKVERYLETAQEVLEESQVSTMGIIKKILLPTIFLLTRNKILAEHKYYNYILNGYLIGVGFYFLFYQTLLVMISRGSVYFNAMEPILLSFQLYLVKDKKLKTLLITGFALLAYILFRQSISTYPEIFIPYRSIFNKTPD